MDKIRVGIIGCGMIANSAHFPALNMLRDEGILEVVGVADIREEAARETAIRHNVKNYYTDPQKLLDELHPDFVAVCTPNVHHKEWTIKALKSGANVACEKPMAVSVADAKEMWDTAKQCNKMLFPCQCMRWRNYMQHTKKMVDAGEIGDVYFSDIEFIRRYGIPTWGMFHMKEHNFGGPFCDLGVHLIDSLLWITGSPKVVSVSGNTYRKVEEATEGNVHLSIAESGAYTGTFTPREYKKEEFNVEEFATGFMRLDNGMSVNFKFSWAINLPTTNLDMVICGDKGGISVNNEMLYKNVGNYQAETKLKWFDNGEYKGVPFEQHRYMYRNIIGALKGEEEYLVTESQNMEVTKIIEGFYKSADTGKEVRFDD
ncbi:MAG: Gfo/Idh/MocA family oxidoreductase [Ruminococcaceae bacterium]|nr:Gfo/Idh/MocA family oxidoreductase [Oscillospiraceae bacterium]